MFKPGFCLILALLVLFNGEHRVHAGTLSSSPIVTTKYGQLRGQALQIFSSQNEPPIGVYQFTAIPFASPPVGELRFKKTKPLEGTWSGILDATRPPNPCTQNPPPFGATNDNGDEDCLYLNVWVPKETLDDNLIETNNGSVNQPLSSVFVFIHGGAFTMGSTMNSLYNGSYLAGFNKIIVVTIQYRLGTLGFGYLGNAEDIPGNMGLWDQLEALRWVSENIDAFGGNSNEITIGGESAGAVSASLHLLSPYSRKYFHRAIIQSGTAISPWGLNSAEVLIAATNMAFEQICNETNSSEKMKCLLTVEATKFPAADEVPSLQIFEHTPRPFVDGDFIPRHPMEMLESGDYHKAPILIGANQDEGSIFVAMSPLATQLLLLSFNPTRSVNELTFDDYYALMFDRFKHFGAEQNYPNTPPNKFLMDAITLHYWPQKHDGNPKGVEVFKAVSDAEGHQGMLCPSYVLANITAASVRNVFAYYFTHRAVNTHTPEFLGVMHGDELAFMFGQPFAPPSANNPGFTEEEKELSRTMMTYWANFIKYGDPNGVNSDLPTWPLYVGNEQCREQYFQLNIATTLKQDNENSTTDSEDVGIICGLKKRDCLFWHDYLPKLSKLGVCASPPNVSNANNNNTINSNSSTVKSKHFHLFRDKRAQWPTGIFHVFLPSYLIMMTGIKNGP